jgi:glycosyltransferase involved in cell wall biosynthesis
MIAPPRISTVIPVYNNAVSTARAVASVLRQSSPAHEIILIDDASRPGCGAAIDRRLAGCSTAVPIRYERLTENGGPGLARHRGAALATGSYVAFLDADDLWHRRKIEEVSRAITDTGAALVGHHRPWAFELPAGALTQLSTPLRRPLSHGDFLKRNPIPTSSIVARADIAREMFRFGGRKSEDYMALIIAERSAGGALFLDAPLCWAKKPPFGHSGEGADQMAIYRASAAHMLRLRREGVISARDLAVFFGWFAIRVPVGVARLWRYRRGGAVRQGAA